ncbi:MAG: hypothetical protein CMN79_05010 [Spirochaetales bacterium]|jgi:glycosyltransferase involved in cell wall biosynthesis|nr:hypothetical protein [Spirochaetales bacterium]|tara:strand:- start:2748 stop:2912 length:165 start_codon:yes stop_codon:yes gene_type:complete
MKYKYEISIIIPYFNIAKELDKCLASLYLQTIPKNKFEIIVVNDGSNISPKKII